MTSHRDINLKHIYSNHVGTFLFGYKLDSHFPFQHTAFNDIPLIYKVFQWQPHLR